MSLHQTKYVVLYYKLPSGRTRTLSSPLPKNMSPRRIKKYIMQTGKYYLIILGELAFHNPKSFRQLNFSYKIKRRNV